MADIKRSKDDKKLLDSRPCTGIDFGFLRENAHEGVPAVTGTIKDWCESLIFYQ